MEIKVKITSILQPSSFVSKKDGSQVNNYAFLGTTEGEYPRTVKFDVMGDDRWGAMNVRVGVTMNVSFDISSREWNGRWYTNLNAWKAAEVQAQPLAQPQVHVQPQMQPMAMPSNSGLPF